MQKQKIRRRNRQPSPLVAQHYAVDDKQSRLQRLRDFINRHRIATMCICGAVLIAIGGAVAFVLTYRVPVASNNYTTPVQKKPVEKYYSHLNGIEVASKADLSKPVTAIMIENSPDARPHSGLKQAEVVYEAIAEGGITRFLTLFQQHKPQLIGPVRSLRMYYVDWLAPYQASVAHVGGSHASLQEIRNGKYRDIDQFFNGSSYWRANDRRPPHNVYTSFEKLDALNASKGYKSSQFTSFARADGKASDKPNAVSIDINFSSSWYNTHYDYDKASNTYLRSIGGQASNDREEGRLAPSVVIALHVNETTVMEDGWRQSIVTTGTGTATVFQNGTVAECTWRKNDRFSPLELIDAAGKPVALNRGQTWIAAVPNSGGGGVSWQ
ncbi:MAG: DUF3048 domain-containing protein [Candidatus Saccharimonas sp.]